MPWYRDRVDLIACAPQAALDDAACIKLRAYRLSANRGHTLFAFEDLGMSEAVWLPDFTPHGQPCFRFDLDPGEGDRFGFGTLTISQWLADQRAALLAKKLLTQRGGDR